MFTRIEEVVAALQKRLSQSSDCPHPSLPFGIAVELTMSLDVLECRTQLLRLLSLFEQDMLKSTVAHVVSAGALICAAGLASEEADEWRSRWERAMGAMMVAHPPLSKDLLTAVYFSVAQAMSTGRSVALVKAAGMSLCGVATKNILPEEAALELLSQSADALVGEREPQQSQVGREGMTAQSTMHDVTVREELIRYALDALLCRCGDAALTSLLTRRVLIPLLLSGGREVLVSYHRRVQSLLLSFSAARERQGEVVILIAALFEYMFQFGCKDRERDYRYSSHLWDTLFSAFWDAITCKKDAGHRANLQLRVEYLLKRIVGFTHDEEVMESWTAGVYFHRYFVWIPTVTKNMWDLFFLFLEATNQYGLHIIQPALPKLDVLVEQLDADIAFWRSESGSDGEAAITRFSGGLHPLWIELLFLKMLLHPNIAFRKIGLLRLWSLSTPVLQLFSSVFLFSKAVGVSLDTRLCSEVDRASHLTSLLDTKGFEGEEERSITGMAGPLADQLGCFYARVFRDVLRTAQERKEAMQGMLRTVVSRPSVHAVTLLLRILNGIAEALVNDEEEESRQATLDMITDSEILHELMLLLRAVAHDHVPFWLDVRLSAIAFSTLLHFARIDPAVTRGCDGFWRLLCMCGPLGHPGGNGAVASDSVGHIGTSGSFIDPYFLNDHLLRVSLKIQMEGSNFGFMRAMVRASGLLDAVRLFLRSAVFDEVGAKQLFFLSGALHTAEAADQQVLAGVAHEIATTLLSFVRRPYSTVGSLLAAMVAFVEFHHSVGSDACVRYYSLDTIVLLMDAMHTMAIGALLKAVQMISAVKTSEDLFSDAWALQNTTEWDAVVAVVVSAGQIAVAHDPSGESTRLQSRQRVEALVHLLVSGIEESPDAAGGVVAQHLAKMLVSRNVSRLLQGLLSSRILSRDTSKANLRDFDISMMVCRCHTNAADPPRWIRELMRCPMIRLTACDIPSPLTDMSWSNVLAQYYGGVYNAVFILCSLVDPLEYADLVLELQEYGLDHLERCWGSNLTSVYDILSWVAAAAAASSSSKNNNENDDDLKTVDCCSIIGSMFAHLKDVGAREYVRASVLAFDALRCCVVEHEELFKSHILQVLLNEADSERSVYLAAVTVAAEVLRNPAENWSRFRDLLLHVAVLCNSSREEEAAETMVAATESLLQTPSSSSSSSSSSSLWSDAFHLQYPPTVRLSSVGRALAISAILWCCSLSQDWAMGLSLELLEWNTTHVAVIHEPCMPNSKPHRCRIRLWQLLCSLLPMIDGAAAQSELLKKVVQKCLPLTNMGSVRHLMELYVLHVLQRHPGLYEVLAAAMMAYNLRPQVCGSYLLVTVYVILQQLRGEVEPVENLVETLLHRLFQQSTSHQHMLRVISHIGLYYIHETGLSKGVDFTPSEKMIFDYILRAPEHIKFRVKYAEQLFVDLTRAYTPRRLFCTQRKEGNNILMDSIPAAAFERMRFVDCELSCLTGAVSPVEMLRVRMISRHIDSYRVLEPFRDFPHIPHTDISAMYCVDYTAEAAALLASELHLAEGVGVSGGSENIQRKVTPWWNSQLYNELHPRALSRERQPIIVVGSLLQNPVNVAGLFRCGEIFAVEKVIVSDVAVFDHPHFVAAARSAELWLPWDVTPVQNLPAYLVSLRRDGYTLIGIEQTADSVSMASYHFPKRAVILLGSEGQGVPSHLLSLLDVCVEIPQFGLIRSLNVHVTGGIVMYEYTRQHIMSYCVH